jgi:hypothetical protein
MQQLTTRELFLTPSNFRHGMHLRWPIRERQLGGAQSAWLYACSWREVRYCYRAGAHVGCDGVAQHWLERTGLCIVAVGRYTAGQRRRKTRFTFVSNVQEATARIDGNRHRQNTGGDWGAGSRHGPSESPRRPARGADAPRAQFCVDYADLHARCAQEPQRPKREASSARLGRSPSRGATFV